MSTAPARSARPDWGPRGDLDPATVPTYPVVSAEITDDRTIRVNGRTVPVPVGLSPAQAVVDAAAAQARRLPGLTQAIRVSVAMEGQRYSLVVTGDQQVIPLDQPGHGRPRWLLPLLTAVIAGVVILGGAVAYVSVQGRHSPRPLKTPPPAVLAPTGAGANLPVPAPPHFAEQAVWSVSLDKTVAPVVADSSILAVTSDHRLVLLDPANGGAYWEGQDMPSGVNAVHLTHVDGQVVAAAATTTELTYWPVPARPAQATNAGPAKTSATTVDLPQQGTVVWGPTSPLVQLPNQTAGIIQAGKVVTLDIPVGAQAVDAERDTVLALDPVGHWWRVQPGRPFPPAGTLPRPQAGIGDIMRSVPVDTGHVLTVWPTADAGVVAGLVDLATARVTAEMPLAPATDTGTPLAVAVNAAAGHRTALGAVLADATTGRLHYLGGQLRTGIITGAHVYAVDQYQNVVDVRVDLPTPAVTNSGSTTTAIPAGVLGTGDGDLALVAADKVDKRLLYALPPGR
ncbi:MAG TPA: hypothetical protein VFP72_03930 [Kineosporiaceae bacterium]|nr:hypothetical protein [Kineosporiaceae bacterium]